MSVWKPIFFLIFSLIAAWLISRFYEQHCKYDGRPGTAWRNHGALEFNIAFWAIFLVFFALLGNWIAGVVSFALFSLLVKRFATNWNKSNQ